MRTEQVQSLAPKQAETALELILCHQSTPVLLGCTRVGARVRRPALPSTLIRALLPRTTDPVPRPPSGCCGPRRVSAVMGVLQSALPRTHLILQALLPRGMDLLPFLRFRWPNRGTAALAEVNAKFQVWLTEQHRP